jgi:hypothetical protein
MKKIVFHGIAVFAMMACSSQAWGTPLAPGQTVVPAFQSASGFVVQSDTGPQAFNLGDGSTGTVDAKVGTLSGNPLGSGLTFIYSFSVASGLVEHLSGASFANVLTDVAFDNSASGSVSPATVNRNSAGNVVEFNGEWMAGQNSAILIINTNAQKFTDGTIGLIDGGGQTLDGFAPLPAVPEPATLVIACCSCIGLSGVAGWRRWQLRKPYS